MRLFVAVPIPADVRRGVIEAFGPWRARFPRARWVPEENLHVTVKFLGATWPRLATWVPERVGEAAARGRPGVGRLAGVGAFPSPGRARVLWAGLAEGADLLGEVARALDDALEAEFRPERRPFRPHLTVARSDPPIPLPASFGETDLASDAFPIDRVILFRSHLRRPAPRYEPLAEFPLSGA